MTRKPGRCVYCGRRTTAIACAAHLELLAVDPHYGRPPRQTPAGQLVERLPRTRGRRR